jgi:hypothetical protein
MKMREVEKVIFGDEHYEIVCDFLFKPKKIARDGERDIFC